VTLTHSAARLLHLTAVYSSGAERSMGLHLMCCGRGAACKSVCVLPKDGHAGVAAEDVAAKRATKMGGATAAAAAGDFPAHGRLHVVAGASQS
jgi:hypothetical protein